MGDSGSEGPTGEADMAYDYGEFIDAGGAVFNVKHTGFAGGALGDGVDDTDAILAAWDAAVLAGGGTIWFPAGVYRLTNPILENGSRIALTGAPGAVITQPRVASPGFTALPTFVNCTDIHVVGLTFDTNGNDRFGGLRFWDCQRVWVEGNRFFDSAVQPPTGTDRVGLQFYTDTRDPEREDYESPLCQDVVIRNNVFDDLQIDTYACWNVWFQGNVVRRGNVTGGFIAIAKHWDGSTLENYFITDNLFEDIDGACIYMPLEDPPHPEASPPVLTGRNYCTYRNFLIAGNVMTFNTENSGRGVYFGIGSNDWPTMGNRFHDIQILNNQMYVKADAGTLPSFDGILGNNSTTSDIDFQRINISGNVIHGNGTGAGIDVRLCNSVEIRNNQVFDCGSGIGAQVANGNRIEGNTAGGLNRFEHPGAPLDQTLTLGIGSYQLWLTGAGSVAAAADTATGSGFGTATASVPLTLVITAAGTVDFTVAGVVTHAAVELVTAVAFSINLNSSTGDNVFRGNKVLGRPTTRYAVTGSAAVGDVVEQEWIALPTTVGTGALLYGSAASALSSLAVGSAGKVLRSNGTLPVYSTATYPDTFAAGDLPYATAANALGSLTIGASGRVLTSSGSAPQWSANLAAAALPLGSATTVTWDVGSGSMLMLTRVLRVNAPMALGNTPDVTTGFRTFLTLTGGVIQVGIMSDCTPGSDATASFCAYVARVRSAAAAYTLAQGIGVLVSDAIKGSDSTITTLIGIDVADQTQGTNNYSIRTGAAQCQFGGRVAVGGAGSYGGGAGGVVYIANATTVPTSNPSGGGVLYVESGALKYRGSSGTVTILGPA
jgi:parallel beta-helix repeat protein